MRPRIILAVLAVVASAAGQPPGRDRHGDPLPDGAVARLGTVRYQAPDPVRATALSPDGTTVVLASDFNSGLRLHALDAATGKVLYRTDLPGVSSTQTRFLPDGKRLAFSGWHSLQATDPATGKSATLVTNDKLRDSPIAFSPDGGRVAAQPLKEWGYHAPVVVWDATTGKEVATLPGRGNGGKGLTFGPDGKRLLLQSVVPSQADENGIRFGAGSKLALACIDVAAGKILGEMTTDPARFTALSPDGETVAVEADDRKSVRVRHLPTATERCVLAIPPSRFAFGPGGKVLVVVEDDGKAAVWDAATGAKVRDLDGAVANKDFDIVGISNDGRTIAVLDGGYRSAAQVVVWDAATGKRVGRPAGHAGSVTCLAYAADGKSLASGGIDKTVRLWDAATGEHLRVVTTHKEAVATVAISPDGKLVASVCQAGPTRVSRAADGKLVGEFAGPNSGKGWDFHPLPGQTGTTSLAFSADSAVLFVGGRLPEVLAWEVATGKEVVRWNNDNGYAVLGFGAGGDLALTVGGPWLQVWNLKKRQALGTVTLPHDDPDDRRGLASYRAVTVAPGGRFVATSQVSEYQGIRPSYGAAKLCVWGAGGQPIRTLAPTVTQLLAFSPDGRLLASGGTGQSGHLRVGYGPGVVVWDVLAGDKLGELPVTPNVVAFSPDGTRLTTAGRDGDILLWAVPQRRPRPANAPTAAERAACWDALAREGDVAYRAVAELLDAPDVALPLLKDRLRPVRVAGPDAVARLIARLDHDEFAEREAAQQALERMAEGVAEPLARALKGDPGPEVRRRVEELLSQCEEASPRSGRHRRAVATLEWIGTPAARAVLRDLADGDPKARLTGEAQAALKRLQ